MARIPEEQLPLFEDSLLEEYERLDKRENAIFVVINEIREKKQKLKSQCKCPEEWLETKKEYDSGSYLDQASTTVTIVCKFCKKVHDKKVTSHGYYG